MVEGSYARECLGGSHTNTRYVRFERTFSCEQRTLLREAGRCSLVVTNIAGKECCSPFVDGGGIRGYASLLILQRLMHEVAKCEVRLQQDEGPVPGSLRREFIEDELLPAHYFDYMYGTSTGGLISVMLGRLRMTVPQCLEIYRDVGDDLFGKRRSVLPLATKYRHKPLEQAVQRIVREYCKHHGENCKGDDWHPWKANMEGKEGTSSSSSLDTEPQTDRICQA